MTGYLVMWSINIDAESPREAAEKALEIQRDGGSAATVFAVMEPGAGKPFVTVDLSEPQQGGE